MPEVGAISHHMLSLIHCISNQLENVFQTLIFWSCWGCQNMLNTSVQHALGQGWPTRRSRSTGRYPSLSWSIAPDFTLIWQDIQKRTFFNQYSFALHYDIFYLCLYYRPVDRELSRNFLVDPSRRQVGHPCFRLYLSVLADSREYWRQPQCSYSDHIECLKHWSPSFWNSLKVFLNLCYKALLNCGDSFKDHLD